MKTLENDIPDLVPARMVNEYVYCPRLAYIEWVQADFAENYDVAEGRFRHRRVDEEKGALPAAIAKEDIIHARSVMLSSLGENLISRIDIIEGDATSVMPVDYKRGAVPDIPAKAWDADRVQVCAQGLVLRDNGYTCNGGAIYYVESNKSPRRIHRCVNCTTRQAVAGVRAMAKKGLSRRLWKTVPNVSAVHWPAFVCRTKPTCWPGGSRRIPMPCVESFPHATMRCLCMCKCRGRESESPAKSLRCEPK